MRHLVLLASLAAALSAQQPADPGTSYLFHLANPTAVQRQLLEQSFDVLGASCSDPTTQGAIDVVVMPDQLVAFQGVAPGAVLVRRGQPYHDVRLQWQMAHPYDFDPLYYTITEIEQELDAQVALYPGLAQKVDLTLLPGGVRTLNNHGIFALKVSDHVAQDEDEPALLIAAQHHARELNSPVAVIEAMHQVLAGYATDPALQFLVDNYEIYFVPTVNPDGVEHVWNVDNFWRKNRRPNGGTSYGVDNNRNYPFLWGLCGSSATTTSETYRGPSAGSEAEGQTLRNFVALVRPELYLDVHSYGRDVLRLYAPCATTTPTIDAFQQRYCDDLRAPMGYATRDPSGSGEAPEDHWNSGGTLGFLIEMCTTAMGFQPPYATAQAEAQLVWTGVRRAWTTWRPALRGHVRSTHGQAPLSATITYAPNQLLQGEVTKSRARDGRFGLWLPLGNWQVTFAAPGHQSRTTTVNVSSYDTPQNLDIELDPVFVLPTLTKSGSERIGTNVNLTYTSPGDAGQLAWIGWSLGTTPGIALGGLRVLPLNPDFLFQAAANGTPVLLGNWGILDGNDQLPAQFVLPNLPFLVGFTTSFAGVTFDPGYSHLVEKYSAPISVTPLP